MVLSGQVLNHCQDCGVVGDGKKAASQSSHKVAILCEQQREIQQMLARLPDKLQRLLDSL
jgi:hypothetical protein